MKRPVLVWLVLCLIWGSTWLFIKLGLEDLPPISFAAIRFVLAAAVLVGVVVVRRIPLPRTRRDWLLICITGLLAFTINYGTVFWGEQRISSGLAAILQTTIPVFGLVIAHYHLPAERITWAKLCGVLLGMAGVALIFADQLHGEGRGALAGSVAIVVGAFCAAYANVLVKARGGHLDPAVLAAGQMLCGLVPLLVLGRWLEGSPFGFHWTARALGSLLYLTLVGSCAAFLLYYWLVRNMDVTKTMLISLVTPVIAVLLGLWWLDEHVTWRIIAGGLAIMAGIGLNVWRRRAQVAVAAKLVA
ncbi:MAG TPA: EamA family transporter [Pyrinomonadaceae bacterium]|jgi:drug/metabolite transporter (DMT)-like permease